MFSQWATKRVCKFFMKRLLGRILSSELDLEQLDVQLGSGTIQLKDLALNTDYLNDQLGDASVVFKEGSVGSITAKIPWKVLTAEPCEIEVDDLEVFVVPRVAGQGIGGRACGTSTNEELRTADPHHFSLARGDGDFVGAGGTGGIGYMGVDDGVRMIAKMVERVLLGLRVKVTNLIIVFEDQALEGNSALSRGPQCLVLDQRRTRRPATQGLLVARVAYVEYGVEAPAGQFEEAMQPTGKGGEPTMLVKVLKFKGATVEVVDEVQEDKQLDKMNLIPQAGGGAHPVDEGGATDNGFLGRAVPIVMGEDGGGVSGSIQLSMPWRDGSLDVPKINAEFSISPLKIRVSACEIQQLLWLVQSFSKGMANSGAEVGTGTARTSAQNGTSLAEVSVGSRGLGSAFLDRNREAGPRQVVAPSTTSRAVDNDAANTAFLPVSRFISDWMHWAGSDGQRREGAAAEADLAASVDEFFECFDGTRSQVSSSSSGLWNWTRSALSAITAASSLAAGSVVLAPDPGRQVEYSVKARLIGISVELVYGDSLTSEELSSESFTVSGSQAKQALTMVDSSNSGSPMEETVDPSGDRSRDGWAISGLDLGMELEEEGLTADWERGCAFAPPERAEEYLEGMLSEIKVSFMVSENQTELKVTVENMEVNEFVMQSGFKDPGDLKVSRESQEETVHTTSTLLMLLERSLPAFPVSLCPQMDNLVVSSCSSSHKVCTRSKNRGGTMVAKSEKPIERKQLLKVGSSPADYSVEVNVKHFPTGSTGGIGDQGKGDENGGWRTNIAVVFQPLVAWLDVRTLKRLEHLAAQMDTSLKQKETMTLHPTHGEGNPTKMVAFDHVSEHQRTRQTQATGRADASGQGSIQASVCVPCVRVLVCFPSDACPCASGLQKNFIAWDVTMPAPNTDVRQPMIVLKRSDGTPDAHSLLLTVAESSLYLISSVPEKPEISAVIGRPNGHGFYAHRVLYVSQQMALAEDMSVPDEVPLEGASVEVCWHRAETGSWVGKQAWDGAASQQRRGDGGGGIGGSNSDFAAATASEAVEDDHLHLREEINPIILNSGSDQHACCRSPPVKSSTLAAS